MNVISGRSGRAVPLALACGILATTGALVLGPDLAAGLTALRAVLRSTGPTDGTGGTDGAAALTAVLVGLAAAAVELVALWACLVTVVVAVEVGRGRRTRLSGAVPAWARRAVLLACGVALVGGPAVASPAPVHPGPVLAGVAGTGPSEATASARHLAAELAARRRAEVESSVSGHWSGRRGGILSGLPYPDRATGREQPTRGTPRRPAAADADTHADIDGEHHTVRPGDSLWALAAASLPAGAPPADVARATHRLYLTNRAVIGDDPDLIRPGQLLRVPRSLRAPER